MGVYMQVRKRYHSNYIIINVYLKKFVIRNDKVVLLNDKVVIRDDKVVIRKSFAKIQQKKPISKFFRTFARIMSVRHTNSKDCFFYPRFMEGRCSRTSPEKAARLSEPHNDLKPEIPKLETLDKQSLTYN